MPTLSWDGFRFTLDVGFQERETAKAAGFHWDANKKTWWTGVLANARIFSMCADAKANQILNAEAKQVEKSRALTSSIVIPCNDGLEYLPFQKACVEYCRPRKNTLIADQMGTGKSIEATGVINDEPQIKSILLIVPASLRINWARELVKWLVRPLSGGFAFEKSFPDTQIVIMNYELVKRFRSQIDQRHWDLLIFDESHMLKSFTAQRTRYCLGGEIPELGEIQAIQADKRLFMTGTPILNRPYELWPTLTVTDPMDLGISEFGFIDRYTKLWEAPWGNEYVAKIEMMEELQHRLRARVMIRRLKSEVLPQLPPKRRQIIPLPAEGAKKAVQAELDFFNRYQVAIEQGIQKAEETQAGDDVSFNETAESLQRGQRVSFTELAKLRKQTGMAKLPYVIEYIEQALEQEDKVVAFGHHREVIDELCKHFGNKCVKLYGGMTDTIKQRAIDRFQEDQSCKLFVGAISIAQGYTLTAASLAVIFEADWRPAMITQAEDRLHRIGQMKSVLIQHLVFDGSLDANMLKTIIDKQNIIDRALG